MEVITWRAWEGCPGLTYHALQGKQGRKEGRMVDKSMIPYLSGFGVRGSEFGKGSWKDIGTL